MKLVKLTCIRHGSENRSHIIYAKLIDANTNNLLISATLDCILEAVKNKKYILVE